MSKSLKVSLSTDAVIYLPFYLAYFGGDFKDTPYGSVDIQIVGLNDIRFRYYDEELEEESKELNPRLRGDAFMTLDVLFGIADIGIGDVGFVNILRGTTPEDETERKKIFIQERHKVSETQSVDMLSKYYQYINPDTVGNADVLKIPNTNNADLLNERLKNSALKIAGGMIRKPALKGILKDPSYNKDQPKDISKRDDIDDTYKAFTYPKHSTSHYYLQKKLKSSKINWTNPPDDIDFGTEINKADNKVVCYSCDFIALRMANKSTNEQFVDYRLADDLTCGIEEEDRLLWSGFILDDKKFQSGSVNEQKHYRAFFYALDRCMQTIAKFLEKNDSQGLHYYIKSKLTADPNKLSDVYKVLIANEDVKNYLTLKKNANSESSTETNLYLNPAYISNKLDKIIRFFIKDLYYVKNIESSLYYSSLNIVNTVNRTDKESQNEVPNNHILNTIKLRQPTKNDFPDPNCQTEIVLYNIMDDWRSVEKQFKSLHNTFIYRNFKSKKYLKSLTIIISLIGIVSFLEPFLTPFFTSHQESLCLNHILLMPILLLVGLLCFLGVTKFNKKIEIIDKELFMYMKDDLIK